MDKARSGETMKLGAFFHPTGNHVAAWLHPDAQIDAWTNFRHYAEITQTAERGKFDLMFVADAVATRDGKLDALSRWPQYMAYFDPLTLLPALATITTHIGLCATATTSYNEPYHVARKFASLDHISDGRAGWNVVTSSNVSEAFDARYPARAGSSLDPKWSTKQLPALGPAQMTPSCSSAAMSAVDNPSHSP
jgi:alkanesulfonate monooxygenase SsuD/methylene tetrahydromethanopterin reductase-like flavin-dependent oxidoreductase (luciferase family)